MNKCWTNPSKPFFVWSFLAICVTTFSSEAATVAQLESHGARAEVAVNNHKINLHISYEGKKVIALSDIQFNNESALDWDLNSLSNSSNAIELKAKFPARIDFYNPVTNTKNQEVILSLRSVEGGFRLVAEPKWARSVTLKFSYLGDHFFGLSEPLQPHNQLSPDLTGGRINVDVNSEEERLHENYASAFSAFYISSYGYGSFFDTFARGYYDFAINGKNEISHDTGKLDWYLLFGKNGAEIQKSYYSIIGAPKSIPAWSLGPVGWRDQNNGGAAEILDDINHLQAIKIPFTSWFVDRPYSDGTHSWSKMNFNSLFANPAEWIGKIRNQHGLEFMTWTSTATFGDKTFAKHLDGKFSYIDLSDEKSAQKYIDQLINNQHRMGVKGHKIDRADEAFPEYEDWANFAVTIAERRNLYAFLAAKVHDDALRKSWGSDQVTFMRAAWHRSQPYLSAIWGGDPRTSWDGLAANYANAARSAFMGFPVWGTDVGGYQNEGYIPEDLYLRWMQAGSMSGLFEIKFDGAGGMGRDRLPWRYSEAFQAQFRAICEDRMQFLPYLYSLSNTSAKSGSLMQPLAYRHLQDKNTYAIWDEFYLGNAILVAPVFNEKNQRSVYLPAGRWIDFDNTALRYQGGRSIEVDAPLSKLPRFIAENAIYVRGNIYKGSDRFWDKTEPSLTIVASPATKNGSTHFDYIDMLDGNREKPFSMNRVGNLIEIKVPALAHKAAIELLLDKSPKSVRLNGEDVSLQYESNTKKLVIKLLPARDSQIQIAL